MSDTEEVDEGKELDELLAKLKKLKPVPKRLTVLCADGDSRSVPIAPSRQRWQKLKRVMGNLDWLRVEAFDSRGQLLDAFETDSVMDFEGDEEHGKLTSLVSLIVSATARHVKLNQGAVKDALDAQASQSKALLDGAAKCVNVMAQSMEATQRLYEKRLAVLSDMSEESENALMSSGFLDVFGEQIAKAAAPELIKRFAAGNNK